MNEIIASMKNHRSVREFDTEKVVSDAQAEEIIQAALAAPNWMNGQQVSIIGVRDAAKKAALAKAAGNQKYVEEASIFLVFCIDFYRAKLAADKHGASLQVVKDLEAVMIGSTDVGIVLGSAVIAAESMGLGTVPIGGIRKDPQTVIEVLELPSYVFPVVGLAIGYPRAIPLQKPRLPLQAVYHKEKYDADVQEGLIAQYDDVIATYMHQRTNGLQTQDWSSKIAQSYDTGLKSYEKTSHWIKKQGFSYH